MFVLLTQKVLNLLVRLVLAAFASGISEFSHLKFHTFRRWQCVMSRIRELARSQAHTFEASIHIFSEFLFENLNNFSYSSMLLQKNTYNL